MKKTATLRGDIFPEFGWLMSRFLILLLLFLEKRAARVAESPLLAALGAGGGAKGADGRSPSPLFLRQNYGWFCLLHRRRRCRAALFRALLRFKKARYLLRAWRGDYGGWLPTAKRRGPGPFPIAPGDYQTTQRNVYRQQQHCKQRQPRPDRAGGGFRGEAVVENGRCQPRQILPARQRGDVCQKLWICLKLAVFRRIA